MAGCCRQDFLGNDRHAERVGTCPRIRLGWDTCQAVADLSGPPLENPARGSDFALPAAAVLRNEGCLRLD